MMKKTVVFLTCVCVISAAIIALAVYYFAANKVIPGAQPILLAALMALLLFQEIKEGKRNAMSKATMILLALAGILNLATGILQIIKVV